VLENAPVDEAPTVFRRHAHRALGVSPRIRVLGTEHNTTSEVLAASWRGLGLPADLVSPREALVTLRPDDTVVSRLDVLPTLDGIEPGLFELFLLEHRGIRVINSAGALLGVHDKLRTARLLASAGVPHPRTGLITRELWHSTIRPPLVIKPRYGSWGRDVYRCANDAALAECLDAIEKTAWFRHGAISQELVPPCGHDLRVLVANGRVIGAAERVAAPGEWRTNVSLGGTLRPAELSEAAVELARTAAAAVGADLVGVDLLPYAGGYVVLELNGAVDFDQRYSIDGNDIFAEAARALGLSPQRRPRRAHHTPFAGLVPAPSSSRREPS
jgi:RimK family alpha-L-glutamate ligase